MPFNVYLIVRAYHIVNLSQTFSFAYLPSHDNHTRMALLAKNYQQSVDIVQKNMYNFAVINEISCQRPQVLKDLNLLAEVTRID